MAAQSSHGVEGVGAVSAEPLLVAYQHPVTGGNAPLARWAFASTAVGPYLYVYGGVGPASVLDDLALLDSELMVWRALSPTAVRPKDRPDKLHGAAMCTLGGSMLMLFGGQQGRRHLRALHALDTTSLTWRLLTPSGAAPAAREGHSLTAVGADEALLFGGQGRRPMNDLHVLRCGGGAWEELHPAGVPPSPRSGHSAVWDERRGRLVCFGGMAAGGNADGALHVYERERNAWASPACVGPAPSPRTHHSAVLLPGRDAMLVFGGCNAAGVFFNDAHVLALDNLTWARVSPLTPPPPPRYHHCCHGLGGKVMLFGGINPKQAFDGVVLLETGASQRNELAAAAEELARMTGRTLSSVTGAMQRSTSAAGSVGTLLTSSGPQAPIVDDLMRLQLRDLLVKRGMEELHATAQQRAEELETLLAEEGTARVALQKEVLQQRLIVAEAEAVGQALRAQLSETSKALAREQTEHAVTSTALSDVRHRLSSCERQVEEARMLLDSMSAELGILSSRYHRLQQECETLRATRKREQAAHQQQQQQEQQQQQQHGEQPHQVEQQCELDHEQQTGSSPPFAMVSSSSSSADPWALQSLQTAAVVATPGLCTADARQPRLPQPLHSSPDHVDAPGSPAAGGSGVMPAAHAAAGDAVVPVPGSGIQPQNQQQSSDAAAETMHGVLDPGTDEPVAPCGHGQMPAACLLCMCQRFLASTAGSCSNLAPDCAPGRVVQTGVLGGCAGSGPGLVDSSSTLSISELARHRLEAENAELAASVMEQRAQLEETQQQVRMLQGEPAALASCGMQELNALEGMLEQSTKAVRAAVLQRSVAQAAGAEPLRCAVCMETPKQLAFNCGHQTCAACGDKMASCPFCRLPITAKIRLYE